MTDQMQTINLYDAEKIAKSPRKCRDGTSACTLCCRLLPVTSLNKPDNTRCQHQRHGKGCNIYGRHPLECSLWTCRWISDPEHTKGFKRPDRAHYCLDPMPDMIEITDTKTGKAEKIMCLQVWVDPLHRDEVRKDRDLVQYMLFVATEYGWPSIVRFSARDGYVVFPPPVSPTGDWLTKGSDVNEEIGTYGLLKAAGMAPPHRKKPA